MISLSSPSSSSYEDYHCLFNSGEQGRDSQRPNRGRDPLQGRAFTTRHPGVLAPNGAGGGLDLDRDRAAANGDGS